MAQVYFGNTLINQTWLGNTLLNKLELQPWEFILYGNNDFITSRAEFEAKLDFGPYDFALGKFEIKDNNLYATFDYSGGPNIVNPFTFVDNAFTGSSYTALYSTTTWNPSFRMFYQVTSLESIYLVNARPRNFPFQRNFLEQSFMGCEGLTSDKIEIDPFSILYASAFRNCTGLTSFPKIYQCGPGSLRGCPNLNSINWPGFGIQNDGQGPVPSALGFGTGNDNVFTDAANSGSIDIPIFYATVNGGNPDGDLVYLSGTKGWTINYI